MIELNLPEDIFIIPVNNDYLLYAPLLKKIYYLNHTSMLLIYNAINNHLDEISNPLLKNVIHILINPFNSMKEEPDTLSPWNSLIIDLSNQCSLSCKYCYADSNSENAKFIDIDCVEAAVSICTQRISTLSEVKEKHLSLIFHGGSEPTVNWDLFVHTINYVKSTLINSGISFSLSMSTNGFYSEEKARWIASNFSNVSLSMDGYREIQDKQRPTKSGQSSYERVFHTAKIFKEMSSPIFDFGFRVTVTKESVVYMSDIVNYFVNEFPGVGIAFEPAEKCGRGSLLTDYSPAPIDFSSNFIKACEKYPEATITYSGFNGIGSLRKRFCGASMPQFAILPSGLVTACYGYSIKELFIDEFVYGKYDARKKKFLFNDNKIDYLKKIGIMNQKECINCFAKYHCGGNCPAFIMAKKIHKSSKMFEGRCKINRDITKYYLIKEARKNE